MRAICKMSKRPTTWPCAAPGCPLFGDCIVEYQRKEALRQHIEKAINDFRNIAGKNPAAILADTPAFHEMVSDQEMAYLSRNHEWCWGSYSIPIKEIRSDEYGVYLVPERKSLDIWAKERRNDHG